MNGKKTLYKYRGTEYDTKYDAKAAARDEAKVRVVPVSDEYAKIRKFVRVPGQADREVS